MTAGSDAEAGRRGLRRVWIPLTAIGLAVLVAVALWSVPPDLLERGVRFAGTMLASVLALVVCLLWLLFGSHAAMVWRLAAVSIVIVGVVFSLGAVRQVEFTGDMIPSFEFRWQPTRDAVLESHRALQPEAEFDAAPSETWEITSEDVPEYRGQHGDGVVVGPALSRDWEASPPRLMWRQPVGGGYSSFTVVDSWVFTLEQRREREAVVAYDLATGRERWVYDYDALFQETMGGDGPRSTITFHEGRLYALGATGILNCLDAASGTPIWTVNILDVNGSTNLVWGMAGSPLVEAGLVIVNPGNQGGGSGSRSVLALDIEDGQPRWSAGQSQASYASPMMAELDGTRQLLIFDAESISGYELHREQPLWQFDWATQFEINAAQPLVLGPRDLLISSQAGCARLVIEETDGTWSVEPLWQNRNLKCSYANPILYEGHVYGLDEGILVCLDLETGERAWKRGRYGHGQMLLSDDLLVILSEKGELVLVEATPEEFRELAKIQAIEGKTWNNPVLVDGVALVRNHLEMAAYDLRAPTEP